MRNKLVLGFTGFLVSFAVSGWTAEGATASASSAQDDLKSLVPLRVAEPDASSVVVPKRRRNATEAALKSETSRRWPEISIGLRVREAELREKRREEYDEARQSYFLGSINELDEENPTAVRPSVQMWVRKWLGLEVGWDRIRARTFTAFDGHSDGVFEAGGPTLALCLRLPWESRVAPIAGVGRGFWRSSFHPDPWWGLGYSDEATWRELGAPTTPRNNRTRVIETDGDPMAFWFFGCGVRVWSRLFLDLEYRRVSHRIDAVFTVRQYDKPITRPLSGRIPMGYDEWAAGLSWHF